ncbi:MAG: response regulator [Candidatus Omnitrophica bacterium]|nr:response regulator [Candidatus Omnitrophota bacterium]
MSKILVVDDEVSIRNFCHTLFTREGHEVITLPRGDQALEIIPRENVDLVLLDLQIPGEKGLSILQKIRAGFPRLPIVIFSGIVSAEMEKEAYELGAIEVIHKGVNPLELKDRINNILAAKHQIFSDTPMRKNYRMLIVEDEESEANLLKALFEEKGFQTMTARTGEEAIQIVQREKPNIVLLDMVLPGMDGMLTLKRILEIDPNAGVIMMTGVADPQLMRETIELGAYHYVQKPYEVNYLERVIQTRLKFPE